VYSPRLVAFAVVPGSSQRLVAVVHRADFGGALDGMLRAGAVVFCVSLALALVQGLLFSRRLSRPIEVLTSMATGITQAPAGPWAAVPVRTNDEVGALAIAFDRMIARLEEARAGLERRVADATRHIRTLYEVTRATTSTLEIEDVLALIAERTLATLEVPRVVVLWHPPDLDGVVDAFVAARGTRGEHMEVGQAIDLGALCPTPHQPEVVPASALPPAVAARLDAARVLRLPLAFKETLSGVIVAALDDGSAEPDRALASALASQAATALVNAGLFETVRRNEAELRKLSQMRAELQEESLRTMSRELHDGIAQVLTAVNMDLGLVERTSGLEPAAVRARVHEAREQLTALLQDVRTMSQVLRPPMLDFGLVPTLRWYVEKFIDRTGLAVDVRTPPEETRLPAAIELMLYRVAQEALTNVAKHAHASRVELEVDVGADEVKLVIADDGIGFEVDRYRRRPALAGVGLLGMRERVAYFHGTLDIRSRPHAGVRITLRVPLPAGSEESRLVG
jgi:signal transduction histidine kinase